MNTHERPDRLPLAVDRKVLQEVTRAGTLESAVALVTSHQSEDAVAIIDNLDQLSAAFIVSYLRFLAEKGDDNAEALVKLCDELHIRGTLGLIYARDTVYRENSYFAGI